MWAQVRQTRTGKPYSFNSTHGQCKHDVSLPVLATASTVPLTRHTAKCPWHNPKKPLCKQQAKKHHVLNGRWEANNNLVFKCRVKKTIVSIDQFDRFWGLQHPCKASHNNAGAMPSGSAVASGTMGVSKHAGVFAQRQNKPVQCATARRATVGPQYANTWHCQIVLNTWPTTI